jgi:hypothetical protein
MCFILDKQGTQCIRFEAFMENKCAESSLAISHVSVEL